MKYGKIIVLSLMVLLVLFACSLQTDQPNRSNQRSSEIVQQLQAGLTRNPGDPKPGFSANVMAPLHVKVYNNKYTLEAQDWIDFEAELTTAKSIGVDAVSVDVWWGDVEAAGDQNFDWSYYDTIFQKIIDKGLKIVPIMSFHQCGGNVSDDYTSNLPSWIWTHYQGSGISANDMKYQSETGAYCSEVVSLWADNYVASEYIEFMDEFESHYAGYASYFDELNISCGTAGELRYPSYNSHDWGAYPNRGTLQCYGNLAVEDFRNDMLAKYSSLSGINAAWGTSLTAINQVNPPSNPDTFFNNLDYQNIQYGKDFVDWYNDSLKGHGKNMINAAKSAFDNQFISIPLGIKIAGVHWMMGHPSTPRAAEVTAGLIQTSVDFQSASTGHGYANIIDVCNNNNRDTILHFTCLEKDNEDYSPQYSQAQALVFWIAAEAENQNIVIKGENALPGGVTSDSGWNNIENAFDWASYIGFTALRISQVTNDYTGRTRYEQFIDKYSSSTDQVTVHYQEFGYAESYYIHCWDGLSGDYQMNYEGYYNGGHWWEVTLNNAPDDFKFCFKNNYEQWDGVNRHYTNQAAEVYSLPYDSTVYTYRP
ncbi:MAG: family 14 glycosylhydrolase [Spirochaetes bacterium]|nr:family 14 glycosylhydrolase [Spirochaetota bacterium]